MTDEKRPLPSSVSEYTVENPTTTPTEVMEAVGLDESRREQVEHYCAVTRYTLYGGDEGCEIPSSVRPTSVEWADVAEWDVPKSKEASNE